MVVTHFDPKLPVTVLTDASHLHGLGYAIGHFLNRQFKLVTCGSKSLTATQQRYSTIELECLVVHFAVTKCSFCLKGAKYFTVVTDHRPLEGIFKKDLFEIPSEDPGKVSSVCDDCEMGPWKEPLHHCCLV